MLLVNALARVFAFQEGGQTIELADPSPDLTPKQVLDHYCAHYPALTTGTVSGPEVKDGKAVYTFQAHLGQKG